MDFGRSAARDRAPAPGPGRPEPRSARPGVLLVGLALLALLGCGTAEQRPPPRLVVLYVACTVDKGFLSPYAPEVAFTPALQDFASEGLVFRRHVTECGQSGVDFATLFSGTQAYRHGVYSHPAIVAEGNTLIAESFAAAGYETYFWSAHPMASATLGYGQGVPEANVARRELVFRNKPTPFRERELLQMTANDEDFAALLARLQADPERRAFVQIGFTVSHEPYNCYATAKEVLAFLASHPEAGHGVTQDELGTWLAFYGQNRHALNWDLPAARAELGLSPGDVERLAAVLEVTYAACIQQLDAYFGKLVQAIREHGLADECLMAFTTDHGELLYRENARFHWTHGLELAPEILDVPLIVRGPGIVPGSYAGVTRSIDVFPTLAGLAGIPVPASVEGIDLSPVLRGEQPVPRQLAFSHTTLWPEEQVERFGEYALLRSILPGRDPEHMSVRVRDEDLVCQLQRQSDGSFALQAFDLARDPGVAHDLFDPADARHAHLAEELRQYKQRLIDGFARGAGSGVSEAESLERLRAMGYAR